MAEENEHAGRRHGGATEHFYLHIYKYAKRVILNEIQKAIMKSSEGTDPRVPEIAG